MAPDDAGHDWAAHLRGSGVRDLRGLRTIPFASYASEMRVSAERETTKFYIGRNSWMPPEPPRPGLAQRTLETQPPKAAAEGDGGSLSAAVFHVLSSPASRCRWAWSTRSGSSCSAPRSLARPTTKKRLQRRSLVDKRSTDSSPLAGPGSVSRSGAALHIRRPGQARAQVAPRATDGSRASADAVATAVARTLISTFGMDLRHILDAAIWLSTPGWEVERPDAVASALRYLTVECSRRGRMAEESLEWLRGELRESGSRAVAHVAIKRARLYGLGGRGAEQTHALRGRPRPPHALRQRPRAPTLGGMVVPEAVHLLLSLTHPLRKARAMLVAERRQVRHRFGLKIRAAPEPTRLPRARRACWPREDLLPERDHFSRVERAVQHPNLDRPSCRSTVRVKFTVARLSVSWSVARRRRFARRGFGIARGKTRDTGEQYSFGSSRYAYAPVSASSPAKV